jgi:capsular polysaccharide biosynthesis protein
MELKSYLNLIKTKVSTILMFVAVFFVLGVGLTLVQPLKYSSSLSLLVVQDASGATDPYATTRSTEYLSDILSKVTYSTSFFGRVMASGLGVDGNYFGNTNKKISQTWSKTIDVKPLASTGIISVTAYHPNRDQAERIARAVGTVLITENGNYHGLGDKVSIKLLDNPITSTFPVKPNLILNAILALVLGLLFALAFIYLFPETELLPKRRLSKKWREADAEFNKLNLFQAPEPSADFKPLEPATAFEPDFVPANEPPLDWLKDF